MKRIKQILFILVINGVILTAGIVIIELVFGGWLNPNKLNRLHLLPNCKREYNVSRLYKTAHPIIKYTRDEYGLRGDYSDPSDIDILTVGGSTTDQKYIRDGETWQDVLQQQFNRQGVSVVVANAGVNGQSTFGHIKNFEWWFPFIPHLAPSFILFYVGINDFHKDYKGDGRTPDVLLSSNTKYIEKSIKANSAIAHLSRLPPIAIGRAMKVRVHISLKPGVLDPQGRAVHHALEGLGFAGVEDVRVGREIELEVADSTTDEALDEMCRKLLANLVIENYRIEKLETA